MVSYKYSLKNVMVQSGWDLSKIVSNISIENCPKYAHLKKKVISYTFLHYMGYSLNIVWNIFFDFEKSFDSVLKTKTSNTM